MKVGSGEIDVSGWEAVGSTENSEHFHLKPTFLVTIYKEGSQDNEHTARAQLQFQQELISARGGQFGLIVLIDNLVSQDAASRRVYAKEPDPRCFRGVALVGGSFLSRGLATFFLGISRTAVPMKFFRTIDEAKAWLNGM